MIPLRIKENFNSSDEAIFKGLRGVVILGKGRHTIHKTDPYGRKTLHTVFEQVDSVETNIVPIGAYQFTFCKLFNIGLDQESTLRVGDLNDEEPMMRIGVPRINYKSNLYTKETGDGVNSNDGINIPALNHVFGFMIGNGAARDDSTKPIAPDYKNRKLFNPIPFIISNDDKYLDADTKYYGRKVSELALASGEVEYYVKKFDDPAPHIIHSWVADDIQEVDIVDDSVFASTSSTPIESYVEMNFSVSAEDARSYFERRQVEPRINEIGLVTGWYNSTQKDYESIRLFTKYCRPSINLDDGDRIEGVYRLYAR